MTSGEGKPSSFVGASIPVPPIADDDGSASVALRRQLDRLAAGTGDGEGVLRALVGARLFVPVVAVLDEGIADADGARRDKQSSMASVLVESPAHGRALLAFSGVGPMTAWRADARPVAVSAPVAARAAIVEAADALLVDLAGPTPFAVAGDELFLLAAGARVPDGQTDPLLAAAISRVLVGVVPDNPPAFTVTRSEPGRPAVLQVAPVDDPDLQAAIVQRVGHDRVAAHLLPDGLRVRFGDTR